MFKEMEEKSFKGNPKMLELAAFKEHSKKTGNKILLLGITGMDASLFVTPIISQILSTKSTSLVTILTAQALKSITEEELYKRFSAAKASSEFIVLTDKDEWDFWKKSMVVLHIYLRNTADAFILAPMCANTLAKLANGLCDDLLTCICRAWDTQKPMICCPSMPVDMWKPTEKDSITADHLAKLQKYYNAILVGYSKTKNAGEWIEIDKLAEFVPLLSPIVEEIGVEEERVKEGMRLILNKLKK